MFIKKFLILLISVLLIVCVCACTDSSSDAELEQDTTLNTQSSTVPDVSIPTDSSMADSVFDNVSNPTKPAGSNSDENETSNDSGDSTDSTDSVTEATAPNTSPDEMTYEQFTALTPEEQRLYQESFGDLDAFFAWYVAAKEKYEEENPAIEIDGPIDLGKY